MLNQLLDIGFLIAVIACLVLAAIRVRKGPSELLLQRVGFLIAVAACVLLATAFVRWDAVLEVGQRSWSIQLGMAPLWRPPAPPPYTRFSESYGPEDDEDFRLPQADTPGLTITRFPVLQETALHLLFYLWCTLFFFGALYFVFRRDKRDPLLHCGVGVWCGLTTGASLCFAISIYVHGPPMHPEAFAYVGILGGISGAVRSWNP